MSRIILICCVIISLATTVTITIIEIKIVNDLHYLPPIPCFFCLPYHILPYISRLQECYIRQYSTPHYILITHYSIVCLSGYENQHS